MLDEECQILRHSNQWVETIDPSIVAMKALVQGNIHGAHALLEQLSAHLSSIAQSSSSEKYAGRQMDGTDDNCLNGKGNDNPPWVYEIPHDKSQTCTFCGRTWHYCTKCGRDGKWVCSHTDATHRVSYRHDLTDNRSGFRRDSR
jgi:hypothetical protein